MPDNHHDHAARTLGPTVLWLALGFLLAGIGTVLLGPILPDLSARWHLTDQQSGLLFAAKFVGSFIGGVTVPRKLRWGIFFGMLLGCVGFGAFAFSTELTSGAASLFVGGLGLGFIIASTNILAGNRYQSHTGSALAMLNFFWSFGAVSCGILVATIVPRFHLSGPLVIYASIFLATGIGGLRHTTRSSAAHAEDDALPLPTRELVRFLLFLFLYGGLETCMTGWLTTYTVRYSDSQLLGGQSAVVVLWTALTVGRALSSAMLRFMRELVLQRISLAVAALCILALTRTHNGLLLTLDDVLLGLSLAPFFPATFAMLMRQRPSARIAGVVLAVSGLGAALFPYLMGALSTASHSLLVAMVVPFALALTLLLLSLQRSATSAMGNRSAETLHSTSSI
jgi:fucose permease